MHLLHQWERRRGRRRKRDFLETSTQYVKICCLFSCYLVLTWSIVDGKFKILTVTVRTNFATARPKIPVSYTHLYRIGCKPLEKMIFLRITSIYNFILRIKMMMVGVRGGDVYKRQILV